MDNQDWDTISWNKPKKPEGARKKAKLRPHDTDEPPPPPKMPHATSLLIQKGRLIKKMSQKELAARLNLPVNVINNYESGAAAPERRILVKIGNVLGINFPK